MRDLIGQTPEGRDVEVLRFGSEALSVELSTLGARLMHFGAVGGSSIVYPTASIEAAFGVDRYAGVVVAPVANRIAGGAAEIDGERHVFGVNENNVTTLHGGPEGASYDVWDVNVLEADRAVLSVAAPDRRGGFPGNRTFRAIFEVSGAEMKLKLEAESDAPTWANMAFHPFWNVGAGAELSVTAEAYLPVDALKIPTGEVAPVSGIFDLREARVQSTEIDHNFCLSDDGEVAPAARLSGPLGTLEIETDAPGLQVFTGSDRGIALEPQHWPDAMHHAHFPDIRLEPGEVYRQTSVYRLS